MKKFNYKITALIAGFVFFLSSSVLANTVCRVVFDESGYRDNVNAVRALVAKQETELIQELVKSVKFQLEFMEESNSLYIIPMSVTAQAITLVGKGRDMNYIGDSGTSLFHLIATAGTRDQIILSYKLGADIRAKNNEGDTPLHEAVAWENIEAIKALYELGADPNAQNNKGDTPLHKASRPTVRDNRDVVEVLLRIGADPNVQNNKGRVPLHFAAKQGYIGIVKFLVKSKAALNVQNNKGRTPLHLAVLSYHVDIVEFLLDNGANPYIEDLDKKTAMDLASTSGIKEAFEERGLYEKNFFQRAGSLLTTLWPFKL